jgi:hypothetical protein
LRILILFVVAAAAAAQAAITVPPEPTETNAPPGSIVVPPPRGTTTGERPSATATNAPTLPAVPQLTVSLADGSKLIGTTTLKALTLRSEALGKLTVPLERIRQVKFSKDRESVTLTLHNGDRLQAGLADTTLALATIFGPVTVPLDKATELQVRAGGAGCAVEWEALPYPTAHDWGGNRGRLAVVEDEGVLVQGQPVRSTGKYRAPLTISCQVTLEHLEQSAGDLCVDLIPPGLPKDSVVDKVAGVQRLHFALGDQNRLTLNHHRDGQWQTAWNSELPALELHKPHRLEVEIGPDQLRIRVDGQLHDAGKIAAPFEEFHIQLWNWQPSSRWRVRDFTVR